MVTEPQEKFELIKEYYKSRKFADLRMTLLDMEILRDMKDDWGILPLPKLDESTVIQGVELDEDAKTRAASVGSEGTGEGPQDGSTAGSNAVDGF